MKRSPLLPLLLLAMLGGACKEEDAPASAPTPPTTTPTPPGTIPAMRHRLRIQVGTDTFTATLLDSPATTAFKAQLPFTAAMTELNGNEKYYDLPQGLPTNAASPGTIQNGDLMLYGSRTLVLFYQSFRTSYPYTPLGRVDNPAGLAAALGSRDVTVTFELAQAQ